ncbi:MAG: DUF488 domain-containing protein [Promethearchaeota archaeon]
MGKIRVDCYITKLEEYQRYNPNSHFEIITNTKYLEDQIESPLAPSNELLIEAGIYEKPDGSKNPEMPFELYAEKFIEEILNNPKAMNRIKELREILKEKDVFLVCVERDPTYCHRNIIKSVMEGKTSHTITPKTRKMTDFF